MIKLFKISCLVFLIFEGISQAFADNDYWNANLDFKIEGGEKLTKTQIFVAGQVHAILETNKNLEMEGKRNYFCSKKDITTREVFGALQNSGLFDGEVKAEAITSYIAEMLKRKYPCTEK